MGAQIKGEVSVVPFSGARTSLASLAATAHASGDYLNVIVGTHNGADDITMGTPGSWAKESNTSNGFSLSYAHFSLKCSSGSETIPTITFTSSTYTIAYIFTTEGATSTAANYVDATDNSVKGFQGASFTTGRPTPSTAGTLVIGFAMSDQRTIRVAEGVMPLATTEIELGQAYSILYWTWHDAATQIPAFTHRMEQSDESLNVMICIESADGTTAPPHIDPSYPASEMMAWLDGTADEPGYTATNVTGDFTTVDTVTIVHDAGVHEPQTGRNLLDSPFQINTTTPGQYEGCALVLDSSFDLSANDFYFSCNVAAASYMPNLGDLTDKAAVIGLGSSMANRRFWRFTGLDALHDVRAPFGFVIDPSDTTFEVDANGTLSLSAIDRAFFFLNDQGLSTSTFRMVIQFLQRLLVPRFKGGQAGGKASFQTVYDAINPTNCNTIIKQGANQYKLMHSLDLSGFDDFEDSGRAIEPATFASDDAKDLQYQGSKLSYKLGAGSGKSFSFKDFLWASNTEWDLEYDVHASATLFTVSGGVLKNAAITFTTINAGNLSGVTHRGCAQATLPAVAGALNGSTWDASKDSTGAIKIDFATIADLNSAWTYIRTSGTVNFTNNPVGILLNFTGAGNLSGTTDSLPANVLADGNTVDMRIADGGHNVTITIPVPTGSGWSTDDSTGGGTSNITFSAPTLALDINSDTAATLIRYFEDDSQTVVDSTTGTTLAYEYPDADPIDVEALKQGYVPINRQNVTPYNGDLDLIMDFDEAYNASHGLTEGTEYDYVRNGELTINSDQNAFDVYSSLSDTIRTVAGYYNTPFRMVAIPGLTRIDLTDGMTITSMATWKGAGMERFHADDASNPLEKWFAIKSVGTITGATTHYRQTDSGDSTAITLTSNVVDEAFQYYRDDNHDGDTGDTNEYDRSGYMVIKSFLAGSKQGRVDVLANAGVSALASNLYTVPLANTDHDYAGTDPGITSDLTLVAGGTVGGKTFAYEIVDGGTNTGDDIAAQLNYNAATNPNTVIPGGTGLRYFELPDMVIHNATAQETARGYREGTTPTLVGFYVSRSSADHPDFTRFQADDGTYYVPTVQLQANITNLLADDADRILSIYNLTTATQIYKGVAGTTYSATYTEGGDYTAGDQVRIRWAQAEGTTSFKSFSTVVAATSAGWSLDASNVIEANATYATLGIDGPAVTGHTADHTDDEADLTAGANFDGRNTQAWLLGVLTTSAGIDDFWGGYTIGDGFIQIHNAVVNMNLDNTTTDNIRETQNIKIFRDDGAYPVKGLGNGTTGGGGITVRHLDPVYTVASGSVSQTTLDAALAQATTAASKATENNKVLKNKQLTDAATGTMKVYDDDDTTVLLEADLFDDDGSTAWDGTNPINRRDRLIAP